MNTKKIVVWVGILIVLILVAVGFSLVPRHVDAPVVQKSPVLSAMATTTGDYNYHVDSQYYTIDLTFPAAAQISLPADAAAKAELTMEQGLANDSIQFKQDSNLDNLTAADAQTQGLDGTRKYALGASYKQYKSTNTVSYVFTVYQDTLGAHPNSFFQTFTFDQSGNQLQLADVFKPGAAYLPALSALAYKDIVAQLTEREGTAPVGDELDTVRIGTEPSPEALQFFYIDGTTLHLLFPPYQVAAYAAGTFDTAIPMAQLSDILK